MARRNEDLLEQIERDALDESVAVTTALRKVLALGGKSGSEEMQSWASQELEGYDGVDQDDLPRYRIVGAPLVMDAMKANAQIRGQQFSPSVLPEGIREHITEEVPLRDGIGQIAALLKQPQIKLSPPGASDIVRLMNHDIGDPRQQIVAIYWTLAHSSVEGVVDQVRTLLVRLVAEIRANMPANDDLPSAETANQAVTVVVTGKRARANVTTAQAGGRDTTATVARSQERQTGFWTSTRRFGAFIVGLATVAAAAVAIVEFL